MIIEDVKGILDEKKRYMNPVTGKIHTGKTWIRILDRQRFEFFYASDLKSFVEIKEEKKPLD